MYYYLNNLLISLFLISCSKRQELIPEDSSIAYIRFHENGNEKEIEIKGDINVSILDHGKIVEKNSREFYKKLLEEKWEERKKSNSLSILDNNLKRGCFPIFLDPRKKFIIIRFIGVRFQNGDYEVTLKISYKTTTKISGVHQMLHASYNLEKVDLIDLKVNYKDLKGNKKTEDVKSQVKNPILQRKIPKHEEVDPEKKPNIQVYLPSKTQK